MATSADASSFDSASIGDQKETPTTLTGKPIKHQLDNLTNIMMSDGGGFGAAGQTGAKLLPPGFTDKSLVHIPVKLSDIEGSSEQPKKKTSFLRKLSHAVAGNSDGGEAIKVIMMSRGDYLKYWAKGEDGNFLPNVEEPPEGRQEWVRKQLELNEEWRKENPSLQKPAKFSTE